MVQDDVRQLALRTLFAIMRANQQALTRYQPQAYPGQMTLLQTRAQLRQSPQDPTWGWGQFVQGGVVRYEIPGHHLNLLRFPQVQVVAETLTRCLAEADGAKSVSQ